jgi:hypothetical protein
MLRDQFRQPPLRNLSRQPNSNSRFSPRTTTRKSRPPQFGGPRVLLFCCGARVRSWRHLANMSSGRAHVRFGAKRDLHGIQARPPLRGQLISPYTLRPANSRCMLCLIAYESHDLVRRRKRPNRGADARLRAVLWCDRRPAGHSMASTRVNAPWLTKLRILASQKNNLCSRS